MQTLRKKSSPLKYKNETTRFLGDGVSFKAKLIGILEVNEARGDRMCQEALSDLKMAIRAAGEHKQRININIAIDGLRLRDEKTGDSLYHHPVHKISFIAQDMTDSRAFGYIFGSPDTGHRFFGIKTDKAASQVVIAMRDLFQVVFALKKKEIELAKQHLDRNVVIPSPLFSEVSVPSPKSISQEASKHITESKISASGSESKTVGTAVADLVDLELELNSLQQGLNQMERITPSDPFGTKDDPFGDSFTSYPKPILPPPPSSGRERSSRTSESSSMFSPKTPHTVGSLETSSGDLNFFGGREVSAKKEFNLSHEFNSSHEDPTSGDWFTPSAGNSIFEEPALVPEPSKDEKHELTKQEILSQFDVFTELDPLGTGRSKPYIDKKHFFQELKNPPKKVLNDLVSNSQAQPQEQTLLPNKTSTVPLTKSNTYSSDPFGEDPFVKVDPFADADFSKQDPFDAEFNEYKFTVKDQNINRELDKFKASEKLLSMLETRSSKIILLEKQIPSLSGSVKSTHFARQNHFETNFDKFDDAASQGSQLHENPSLDMSSESESAPEPPPRPVSTLMQIKPPPLPPKKQANDLCIKPPPRPPHTEEVHFDYLDNFETAPNSLEYIKNLEKAPPLPVPQRKSQFESDFVTAPERPKKQFNLPSSEDDYLTPVSLPESKTSPKSPGLLPPPQKSTRKQTSMAQVTVSSFLESKPNITTSIADDKLNSSLEGLDITLSQLTLSGLNELATKLNIPTSQLSNMTLVQLTNYLSSFMKCKPSVNLNNTHLSESSMSEDFPEFKADFAANFNNINNSSASTYDRYAVFRELMQEEIKQTKIDTEPEELQEEKEELQNSVNSNINLNLKPLNESNDQNDKYAALREIVESEIKQIGDLGNINEEDTVNDQNSINNENNENVDDLKITNKFIIEEKENKLSKECLIEYSTPLESNKNSSPVKSPIKNAPIKSPILTAVADIMQNNTQLTSGSLSDVVSGSSPEVDNTASNSDVGKKTNDATGESWAIFDQTNLPSESTKEKQGVQSEEGLSPWSSDSKEFGNVSPMGWRRREDSGSGDQWARKRRDQEGWWDTSAEPEVQYYPPNRRSTDSYDEEYYECYERPRRRRQGNWPAHTGQPAGGHSSSSRDVSPWEEEPRRRELREGRDVREPRDGRQGWSRHARQSSFERHRERRGTDSWDEEDDYEYDDEHESSRFHWSERHSSREPERDRHSTGSRDHDSDRWSEDRRHRRRRDAGRDRWCCPDWEQSEHEKTTRYGYPRGSSDGKWRDRKHDEQYYTRDSQESPWEDEYSNEPEPATHYVPCKRNWKRPSSASEMDRKTGEIKSRHYLGTAGGSDGERDRRYKAARRSRSKDSQYSEPSHRHKSDLGPSIRTSHRTKLHQHKTPSQVESEYSDVNSKKPADISKPDLSNKKSSTLANRKKAKDSPKTEENVVVGTFPRKSASRAQSLFENDFMGSELNSVNPRVCAKFSSENDFETSEAESPTISRPPKAIRQQSLFEKGHQPLDRETHKLRGSFKETTRYQTKSKSLFEDDFSPSEKVEQTHEDNSISSIKEEIDPHEEEDSFNCETTTNSQRKLAGKNRLSLPTGLRGDLNLKKSESVNIFARESDPFDDDFFSGNSEVMGEKSSPRNTELRWTEDFEEFDIEERK